MLTGFCRQIVDIISEADCVEMPPKRTAATKGSASVQRIAVKRPMEDDVESDNEYRERRERNNIAVKKSRAKSRARAEMTTTRVEELRRANSELEGKINILSKELDLLKDLLVLRAGKKCDTEGSDDAVTCQSSTTAASCSAAADPHVIHQDHGYVSEIKRTRKSH